MSLSDSYFFRCLFFIFAWIFLEPWCWSRRSHCCYFVRFNLHCKLHIIKKCSLFWCGKTEPRNDNYPRSCETIIQFHACFLFICFPTWGKREEEDVEEYSGEVLYYYHLVANNRYDKEIFSSLQKFRLSKNPTEALIYENIKRQTRPLIGWNTFIIL